MKDNIRKQEVGIKVYAILLSSGEEEPEKFLWTGLSFMLEEAIYRARVDATEAFPEEGLAVMQWLPEMYAATGLKSLIEQGTSESKEETSYDTEKNSIMKKVVANKDRELMKKNIKMFSKEDVKLLEELLKKKN
jgi:hypothetical protein